MSNRLRNQELTGRPRVIVDGGGYTVQWVGRYSGARCEDNYSNLEAAIGAANTIAIARRYAK